MNCWVSDWDGSDCLEKTCRCDYKIMRDVLRLIPNGLVIIDREYRILWANEVAMQRFGEIIGRYCYEIFHSTNQPCQYQQCAVRRVLEDDQEIVEHKEVKIAGQPSRWVRIFVKVALKDKQGNPQAVLKSFRDVTEEQRARQRLLEQRQKLRSMAMELTIAEERERKRLAGILHDEVCQRLVSAKMLLDMARQNESSSGLEVTLSRISEIIESTVRYTHDLTFDVSSPQVYELGLVPALKGWLAEEVQGLTSLDVRLTTKDLPLNLDEDISMFVFRSMRELVFNVIKHAQARQLRLHLEQRGRYLWGSVFDDGVGFCIQEEGFLTRNSSGGYGLFSIKERLAYLGGRLTLKSNPGKGTRVVLMMPVHKKRLL